MKKFCVIVGIICILVLAWCFVSADCGATEPQTAPCTFDTSVIEQTWCHGLDYGTIRMVGAWWYDDHVIEDETGNLWNIEQDIEENDFLLVWIVDNFTPNNVEDDTIVKVWREAY